MDIILLSMLPLLGLLVLLAFQLYYAFHRLNCPDCGDTLPIHYSPFQMTRRQWRAGGYLCPRCGCETNMAGQKVTSDTPPASFLTLQWALLGGSLAVLLLVGVGLVASLIVVGEWAPVVAVVAAPPVVAAPQQAPDVGPVN